MDTPSAAPSKRKKRKHKEARRDDAADIFKLGLAVPPINPYIVWRFKQKNSRLIIPASVVKTHNLEIPKRVFLVDGRGNKWETRVQKWSDGRLSCNIKGWKNLYNNRIKINDICICEFIREECNVLYILLRVTRAHTLNGMKGIEEEGVKQIDKESTHNNNCDVNDGDERDTSKAKKLKSSLSCTPDTDRRSLRKENACGKEGIEDEEIEKIDMETYFNHSKETRCKTNAQPRRKKNQVAVIKKLEGIIKDLLAKDITQGRSHLVKAPCHQDDDESSDNDIELIDPLEMLHESSDSDIELIDPLEMLQGTLPEKLEVLQSYFKLVHEKDSVSISLDDDVFGKKYTICIFLEDIHSFCLLERISDGCIIAYVWCLYRKMKQENVLDRFRFVNPTFVSYMSTRSIDERACALADRLIGASTNQLVLVPCNVTGYHWILTVIDPYKYSVFFWDPLSHCICDEAWQDVVNMALSRFSAAKGEKGKILPVWVVIKAPPQPDLKQHGFYIMRYMKEIIEAVKGHDLYLQQSMFAKDSYSKNEIDEVRTEWADCVLDHLD